MGLKEFRWTKVIQFVNHMIPLLMWNNWHWVLWTYIIKDGRFLFKKGFPLQLDKFHYCLKQQWVLRCTFGEIQIQIYPKTYVELKYGAFYLNNEVSGTDSAHRLGLVVQLSWRVAPPFLKKQTIIDIPMELSVWQLFLKLFLTYGKY